MHFVVIGGKTESLLVGSKYQPEICCVSKVYIAKANSASCVILDVENLEIERVIVESLTQRGE